MDITVISVDDLKKNKRHNFCKKKKNEGKVKILTVYKKNCTRAYENNNNTVIYKIITCIIDEILLIYFF